MIGLITLSIIVFFILGIVLNNIIFKKKKKKWLSFLLSLLFLIILLPFNLLLVIEVLQTQNFDSLGSVIGTAIVVPFFILIFSALSYILGSLIRTLVRK